MHKFFLSVYYFIRKNRILSAVFAVVFLILCSWAATKINFNEDISQIIPKSAQSDITAKVLAQTDFSDKIVVIIQKKEKAQEFTLYETADAFVSRIEPLRPKFIRNIQGKVDEAEIEQTFNFVAGHLPLFLDKADYAEISNKISADSIAQKMHDNLAELMSPKSFVTKDFIKKDPLGIAMIGLRKFQNLQADGNFTLENNYIVSKDGNSLLLFIQPKFGGSETKNNEQFADALEGIKTALNRKFSGRSEVSYFGPQLIAAANARQIKHDIQSTVLITTALLFLLLIFYFKNILAPLIIFIPTVFGAAAGLLAMFFFKDRISAISLSVSAILIGITIDYAIHVLTHYKHSGSVEEMFKEITPPVIMSALTTAVSFLCLVFVKSEALKDLGIFASITVMLSAIFTLIIVPQIYTPKAGTVRSRNFIDRIGAYPYEKNRWLVIICGLVIFISFFGWRHVKFNQDISQLNFVPDEMRVSEKKLEKISDFTNKSIYAVSYGKTGDEALEENLKLQKQLTELESQKLIKSYVSAGALVLPKSEQQNRINLWNSYWAAEKKSQTLQILKAAGKENGFSDAAFEDFEQILSRTYSPIDAAGYNKLAALAALDLMQQKNGLATVTSVIKIDEKNRDAVITAIGKNNNTLAIDRQQLNENFLGLLKDDFNSLINYSLIAVIVIFLLFFRNIDLTIMAVIPIVLSGIVTAGILYFLKLELNIFSTIVCTLIFGAGVDFNIFLTQALQKELTTGEEQLPVYRVSIILALLTTVLAIGALIFAKHPALHSVAAVALIGLLAVVIISFAMYPLLFNFIKNRAKKGLSPVTFRYVIHSALSFLYYGLGSFLISIFSAGFIKNANTRQLRWFKKWSGKFLASVLYSNPFVKKKVIRNTELNFDKPAVIIANHTSFLDTLAVTMAYPQVVFLVNDWVYRSPVFGRAVRAMGFYPVSQGIENSLEKLTQKIAQGFSLMVFPEATRTLGNDVKRFHKGAFYLAQELGLDIIPMYIHGNSEVLPKHDFIIHDGSITVKFGERIRLDDQSFGTGYSDRTKKINFFFRKQFLQLRTEIEGPDYWKKTLLESFMYKDSEVISAVRKDFAKNKNLYAKLNQIIGLEDHVMHFAGDYGQLDVLLSLHSAKRKISGVIYDDDKRKIAANSYLTVNRSIEYFKNIPDKAFPVVVIISTPISTADLHKIAARKIIVLAKEFSNTLLEANYTLKLEDKTYSIWKYKNS